METSARAVVASSKLQVALVRYAETTNRAVLEDTASTAIEILWIFPQKTIDYTRYSWSKKLL
mgnify:CR=1 FL=1